MYIKTLMVLINSWIVYQEKKYIYCVYCSIGVSDSEPIMTKY